MAIKCVMFDVGGVLMDDSIDPVYKSLNRKIGKRVFERTKYVHQQALLGKITPQRRFTMLSRKCSIPAGKLRKMLTYEYIRIIKVNRDAVKIAERLRKNDYRTPIISNMTEMAKQVNKKRGLFVDFSPVILSCDVGMVKPQKRIYRLALKRVRAKPEECIYIEDRKEFLAAPKSLGINVIHFRSAAQLERDLRKLGVRI